MDKAIDVTHTVEYLDYYALSIKTKLLCFLLYLLLGSFPFSTYIYFTLALFSPYVH